MKKSLVSSLNSKQLKAVNSQASVVAIQAGPGTGKTHTLAAKLIDLLKNRSDPRQVIALTFTHKAAAEMKERVQRYFPKLKSEALPFIGTFHSFAINHLQIDPARIITENQQTQLIFQIIKDFDLKDITHKDALLAVSQHKTQADSSQKNSKKIIKLLKAYQQSLSDLNKLDYDDLLLKLLEASQQQTLDLNFKYLLVDEFQDLDHLQHQLLKIWRKKLKQLFVIGDQYQAIYGFRGADNQGFKRLKQSSPELDYITLSKNYRNPQLILDIAQQLFPKSASLKAVSSQTGQAILINTLNQYTEANWITGDIEKRVGGTDMLKASDFHQEKATNFSQFAIIYRTHFLNQVVSKRLDELGIPYQQLGQESLYAQPLIQLIIDFLRLKNLQEKDSKKAEEKVWRSILSNPWVKISLAKLTSLEKKAKSSNLSLFAAVKKEESKKSSNNQDALQLTSLISISQELEKELNLIESVELIGRELRKINSFSNTELKHFHQLKTNLISFEKKSNPLPEFLAYINQIKNRDYYDHQAEKVSLLTMHAAKGLEFDFVYLIGFEQGIVPHQKSLTEAEKKPLADQNQLAEEKRLFYVALTRAKKGVFLLRPKFRFKKETTASQFQALIEDKIEIQQDERLKSYFKKKKKREMEEKQSSLF